MSDPTTPDQATTPHQAGPGAQGDPTTPDRPGSGAQGDPTTPDQPTPAAERLLRWYPPAWRRRYGDELVAMVEDELAGHRPSLRLQASLAAAGLSERSRECGLVGGGANGSSASVRVRQQCLVVLCAWSLFVLAGISFAKLAEHFPSALPHHRSAVASGAFDAIEVLAVLGGLAVLAGAATALPAFLRFARGGGWPLIRARVITCSVATALTLAGLGALAAAARTLSEAQRNGGSWPYATGIAVVALVGTVTLVLWTSAAVSVARRLDLSGTVLATELGMAVTAMVAMVLMTAATAGWWAVMASSAPWFLWGAPAGSAASPFEPNLVATMAVMVAATALAIVSTARAARARAPRLQSQ